jgi:hypothetical protein
MLMIVLWFILFILCWPIALLALVLYPFIWLLMLPFRVIGITVDGLFAFLKALILLPSRIIGRSKK